MTKITPSKEIPWDGIHGADQAMDQGPVTHGSLDHHERPTNFDHLGGAHDTPVDNRVADRLGETGADEMSQRGADSLKILEQPQRIRDAYAGIEAERDDPDVEDEDDAKPARRVRR